MAARHTIWKWAGIADDWWGRLKVLAFVFTVLAAGLFALWAVAIRSLGVLGLVVLVLALVFAVFSLLLAREIWFSTDETPGGVSTTDQRRVDLAVEVRQEVVAFFLNPGEPEEGRFFWIHNVTITNRSSAAVSLMPSLAIELKGDNYVILEQRAISVIPVNFTGSNRLIKGPIDLDPNRTCSGDFGFELLGIEEQDLFGSDFDQAVEHYRGTSSPVVMYFVLQDLVSGEQLAFDVTYRRIKHPSEPETLEELRARRTLDTVGR